MYRVVNNLQGKGDSVECRGEEEEEMREREREKEREKKKKACPSKFKVQFLRFI